MAYTDFVNESKTLRNMKDYLYFILNEDSETFPESDVTMAIDSGLRQVYAITHRDPDIVRTLTDQNEREYVLPEARLDNGTATVDAVWIDDNALAAIAYTPELSTDETGTPTSYYVRGGILGLVPTADLSTYILKIRYRKDFHELTEDDDTTDLSDTEVNASLYYAAFMLKVKDEEFQAANFFKGVYDDYMEQLRLIPTGVYKTSQAAITYGGAI